MNTLNISTIKWESSLFIKRTCTLLMIITVHWFDLNFVSEIWKFCFSIISFIFYLCEPPHVQTKYIENTSNGSYRHIWHAKCTVLHFSGRKKKMSPRLQTQIPAVSICSTHGTSGFSNVITWSLSLYRLQTPLTIVLGIPKILDVSRYPIPFLNFSTINTFIW